MTWLNTEPVGSRAANKLDDYIRETRADIETALSHEDSTFPGATPATPIFIPGFLRNTTANRPTGDSLVEGRLYCNTTLAIIERYNGSSWDSVATLIPSGTKMLFYQASPPTGWTGVDINNLFLRVVSPGLTGGSTGGSGLVPTDTIVLAHSHTVSSHTHTGPSHTHTISSDGGHTHDLASNPGAGEVTENAEQNLDKTTTSAGSHNHGGATAAGGTGSTGSAAPATDSQLSSTAGFQYADISIATKD